MDRAVHSGGFRGPDRQNRPRDQTECRFFGTSEPVRALICAHDYLIGLLVTLQH